MSVAVFKDKSNANIDLIASYLAGYASSLIPVHNKLSEVPHSCEWIVYVFYCPTGRISEFYEQDSLQALKKKTNKVVLVPITLGASDDAFEEKDYAQFCETVGVHSVCDVYVFEATMTPKSKARLDKLKKQIVPTVSITSYCAIL